MARLVPALVIMAACSKSDTAKPLPGTPFAAPTAPTGETPATPAAPSGSLDDDSPTAMCTRLCMKALGCAGVAADQIAPCTESCVPSAPDKAKVRVVEAASCEEVLAILNGQGKPAAAAPAANGCTADCRTCMGDGNSCWAAGGGTNGIPCDPCCCAPGGPAKVWRTP